MKNKRPEPEDKPDRESETGKRVWPWEKNKPGKKKGKTAPEEQSARDSRSRNNPDKKDSKPRETREIDRSKASSRPPQRKGERPSSAGKGRRNPFEKDDGRSRGSFNRDESTKRKKYPKKAKKAASSPREPNRAKQEPYLRDEIRLNKYIAHAGLCSRREADEYISAGKVKVNGKVVTELGSKVTASDKVEVDKQKLSLEPFVYILLNKGKDTISTTDDEKDRNTVLDAIENATGYRVYPVGRLDRNTMGLLILTNDGDLAHRLMHPSYNVKKTYEVQANRGLTPEEVSLLRNGFEMEDGPVKPVSVKQDKANPDIVTISVFEGRNHLIRRMINHIGADVAKLKRTHYAGLNDSDTRTGRWRYLKQKEINDLRKLVKLETLDFKRDEK